MSSERTHGRRHLWTGLALILPLLYLQQLAPHHHALPEATPNRADQIDHRTATPHHHTHGHQHHGEPDQRANAHHHHTLAAHLDLHAPPAVPVSPDGETGIAVAPTAPMPVQPDHSLRPTADTDPPTPLQPACPAAPRGPPHRV